MSVLIRFDGERASGKTVLRQAISKLLREHGATVNMRDRYGNDNDDIIVTDIDFAKFNPTE